MTNVFQAQSKRVLIIEENRDVLYLIRKHLERQDFEIEEARSNAEASAKIFNDRFEVIVFAGTHWEDGAQLYCKVLSEWREPAQFVMFLIDPSALPEEFRNHFTIVKKFDFDRLLLALG